jgi:DNA-binding MarR family transcriptional regulator/N-acetylglutamate synthase-like GNAT family acetyltransferase
MPEAPSPPSLERNIAAVRRFNRFYTAKIGALREDYNASPFSLAEARVLYELANRERPSASELARDLGLNPGYLSRILSGFEKKRLVVCERSAADRRKTHLVLTEKGRHAFAPLNARSRQEIGALLGALPRRERERLVAAMHTIEALLAAPQEVKAPYLLRPHQPGDMGWVIGRHGALYAEEYGWDDTFEALVAEIAAKFLRHFDPKRERCWIAEKDGETVGSVFLVKKSATVAQLRLLLVDPKARGLGIGVRLVEECIAFARRTGYRKIVLWTNDILHAARRIYQAKGFRLVEEEKHRSFGHDLVGQIWELGL